MRLPSPEEQDPEAPGRPSQGCRLPWRFRGLAGAEGGQLHAAAAVKAAAVAELERRRRQQEGALGDEQMEGLQLAVGGRQQRTFCAAEKCWAKSSTGSPNRPAWEIGESKKQCLSDSLISAKVALLDH